MNWTVPVASSEPVVSELETESVVPISVLLVSSSVASVDPVVSLLSSIVETSGLSVVELSVLSVSAESVLLIKSSSVDSLAIVDSSVDMLDPSLLAELYPDEVMSVLSDSEDSKLLVEPFVISSLTVVAFVLSVFVDSVSLLAVGSSVVVSGDSPEPKWIIIWINEHQILI